MSEPAQDPAVSAADRVLTVYTQPGCHLCEEAMTALRRVQPELGYELQEVDISTDDQLLRAYLERIPVVCVDGQELCEYFVDETALRERLESRR